MKSTTIRNFQALFIKHVLIFFDEVLLFINLFCLGPKGCKLLKINTSFRIRGREGNFFTSFLSKKKFYQTLVILNKKARILCCSKEN
jgi:hypothetical protein